MKASALKRRKLGGLGAAIAVVLGTFVGTAVTKLYVSASR